MVLNTVVCNAQATNHASATSRASEDLAEAGTCTPVTVEAKENNECVPSSAAPVDFDPQGPFCDQEPDVDSAVVTKTISVSEFETCLRMIGVQTSDASTTEVAALFQDLCEEARYRRGDTVARIFVSINSCVRMPGLHRLECGIILHSTTHPESLSFRWDRICCGLIEECH